MKLTRILAIGVVATSMLFTSCKKEEGCTDGNAINYEEDAEEDDGSCEYKGKITFWTDEDKGCGEIKIKMGGEVVGTLSNYSTNGVAPECGDTGWVTLELEPGTYSYNAVYLCGSWSNTFTIKSNGCHTELLDQ